MTSLLMQAVIEINTKLFDQGFNDGEVELVYSSDGFTEIVKFLGCKIFNSDNDYWGEDSGFETAQELLQCRVVELLAHLKEIDFNDN